MHILRYEALQNDTLGEVKKVLEFLNVFYDSEILAERLRESYSEFHRPHSNDNFKHYSLEQKQLLRSVLMETIEAADNAGKSHLLHLNDYLFTIHS